MVDGRLRALGLELVEDRGEPFGLPLVEAELVGEDAQGPAHSERAAREAALFAEAVAVGAAVHREAGGAAAGVGVCVTGRVVPPPPGHESRMHGNLLSPGLVAPGGVDVAGLGPRAGKRCRGGAEGVKSRGAGALFFGA